MDLAIDDLEAVLAGISVSPNQAARKVGEHWIVGAMPYPNESDLDTFRLHVRVAPCSDMASLMRGAFVLLHDAENRVFLPKGAANDAGDLWFDHLPSSSYGVSLRDIHRPRHRQGWVASANSTQTGHAIVYCSSRGIEVHLERAGDQCELVFVAQTKEPPVVKRFTLSSVCRPLYWRVSSPNRWLCRLPVDGAYRDLATELTNIRLGDTDCQA